MTSDPVPLSQSGRLTPFVGRKADLQRLVDLCQDPSVRLVTILGAGGIGKSRFVLEALSLLDDLSQRVAILISLAPLNTGDELLPALVEALGVQLPPGSNLQQAVLDHLTSQKVLLIFDNFENLLDESFLIWEILTAAPQVKVLVTSREKLRLEAETLFYLKGLELPPEGSVQGVDEYDAVSLFLQQARQARPDFSLLAENIPHVIQICRLVGGNPLGILLAAAWIEHFSPNEIVDQINSSLDFLASSWRDIEPRHACMRAVFDSSYLRLDRQDQVVFRKLAVFRGGFDLAAAQGVAGADLRILIGLVEKSLLTRSPGSGRYDMHEMLRHYAGEQLAAANERELVTAAHTNYYTAFVRERESRLISQAQTDALNEIRNDFDNIRQAFSVVIENRDYDSARAMLPVLYGFCDMHSRFYEGVAIFQKAVEGLSPQPGERPHPSWALALLSWYDLRGYSARVEAVEGIESKSQSCLENARTLQDPQGIASSLVLLGAIAEDQGDFIKAIHCYDEAMQADPFLDDVYWVNMRTGLCRQAAHQYPEAIQAFRTSLQRGQKTGERVKTAWSLVNIGDTLLLQRKTAEAEGYLQHACTLFQEVGTLYGLLWSNYSLSRAALELGNPQKARQYGEISWRIARQIHSSTWIKKTDDLLGQINPVVPPSPGPTISQDQIFLSQREQEVMQLLKSELSGPEIADRLFISLNTVRFHTKNLYQKLGVNTRLEAIRRAQELGL